MIYIQQYSHASLFDPGYEKEDKRLQEIKDGIQNLYVPSY